MFKKSYRVLDKPNGIIYIAIVFKSLCKGAQQIKHTPTHSKFIAQLVQLA